MKKNLFISLALAFLSIPAFATVPGETVIVDGTVTYTTKPADDGCSFLPNNTVVSAEYEFSKSGCAAILTGIKHVRAGAGSETIHDGSFVVVITAGDVPGRFKIQPGSTQFAPSASASLALEAAFEHAIANAN